MKKYKNYYYVLLEKMHKGSSPGDVVSTCIDFHPLAWVKRINKLYAENGYDYLSIRIRSWQPLNDIEFDEFKPKRSMYKELKGILEDDDDDDETESGLDDWGLDVNPSYNTNPTPRKKVKKKAFKKKSKRKPKAGGTVSNIYRASVKDPHDPPGRY